MKKLFVALICIGLMNNAVAISPIRAWKCRPSNPSADCSPAEINSSKNWFKNAKIGALAALGTALAAIGLSVTIQQLQNERNKAEMSGRERIQQSMEKIREAQAAAKSIQRSETPQMGINY